jgi:hypothetical protein
MASSAGLAADAAANLGEPAKKKQQSDASYNYVHDSVIGLILLSFVGSLLDNKIVCSRLTRQGLIVLHILTHVGYLGRQHGWLGWHTEAERGCVICRDRLLVKSRHLLQ